MKEKGFGMIGLIITLAIIAFLIFGYTQVKNGQKQNEVQSGNEAIKQAQDAADKERQDNQTLQDQVQDLQPDLSPNTYHNIEDRAKSVSQKQA